MKWGRALLAELAELAWRTVGGVKEGDTVRKVLRRLWEAVSTLPLHSPERIRLTAMGLSGDTRSLVLALIYWHESGLPTIRCGHKVGAALMATKMSPKAAEGHDVEAPWPCFVVDLPTDLLHVEHHGERKPLTTLVVHKRESVWDFLAYTSEGVSLWKVGSDTSTLLEYQGYQEGKEADFLFPLDLNDGDKRTQVLLGRLVLGICASVGGKERRDLKLLNGRKGKKGKRRKGKPEVRIFQLGKDIQLDCRPAVKDYLTGRTSSEPTVQSLVAGHWKRQPHGPKREQRKWVWIEPYWRGPEDGPIVVRSHVTS